MNDEAGSWSGVVERVGERDLFIVRCSTSYASIRRPQGTYYVHRRTMTPIAFDY